MLMLLLSIKMFGGAFVLPITGTPYDLIYGNQGAMFFDADERVLRTRNDLYRLINNEETKVWSIIGKVYIFV